MKRKSFARRNTLLPRGVRLAGVGALAAAAIIVLIRFFAPGAFIMLAEPLWRLSNLAAAGTKGIGASLENPVALHAELDSALASNTEVMNKNAALAMQVHDLESLLGSRTEPQRGVLAGVLARPPMSPYDTLVIDEGSSAGIAVGVEVTGPGGSPIGTIASVAPANARVELYSAPGISLDAWIGTAHIPVTLIGVGGGAFSATIDKNASTTSGDIVYAPGPGALPIGTVVRIDSGPSSPTATLRIEPAVNPYTLTWVLVAPPPP